MSGVNKLLQSDTKGLKVITNEMLREEATESPLLKEEKSEQAALANK